MYLRIFTATDFVGHETITSSPGVTIDVSPPATPGAISTGGSVHNHIEQVKISWFGAFTDQESGVYFRHCNNIISYNICNIIYLV